MKWLGYEILCFLSQGPAGPAGVRGHQGEGGGRGLVGIPGARGPRGPLGSEVGEERQLHFASCSLSDGITWHPHLWLKQFCPIDVQLKFYTCVHVIFFHCFSVSFSLFLSLLLSLCLPFFLSVSPSFPLSLSPGWGGWGRPPGRCWERGAKGEHLLRSGSSTSDKLQTKCATNSSPCDLGRSFVIRFPENAIT